MLHLQRNLLILLLLVVLSGCFDGGVSLADREKGPAITRSEGIEYAPQMYHSYAYEPYSQTTAPSEQLEAYHKYNPNGMNMRVPAQNTVARGQEYPALPYGPYETMMADGARMEELYNQSSTELNVPDFVPNTEEVLAEGQRLYEIFCDHCHGTGGKGDGPISKNDKIKVPSYLDDARKNLSYGQMYFSITYGKNAMGPHAGQLNAAERWMLVRYVRKLQGRAPEAGGPTTDAAAAPDSAQTASAK